MRLRTIHAGRYGVLRNDSLSGLGDKLTIVLGPNESGKSTYTSLVRHVLFGYPKASTAERGYQPASGDKRVASVVFDDPTGEWAIERVEAPKGGIATTRVLKGAEVPDLLGTIVGGVSEQEYKVIYGFGLDELASIESAEGSAILSRLYAATTGLDVNPRAVRDRVRDAEDELFKAGGSKPALNDAMRRLKENRELMRDLGRQADEVAADEESLGKLAARLEPLKALRDELDTQRRTLELDAQRTADLSSALCEAAARSDELATAVTASEQRAAESTWNERIEAVEPELRVCLAEVAAFKANLDLAAERASLASQANQRLAELGNLPSVEDSPELRVGVEHFATRLTKAELDAEQSAMRAERAEAEASGAETAQQSRAQQEPIPGPAPARSPLGWVFAGAGVLLAAVGFAVGNALAGAFGVAFALGGVGLLLWGGPAPRPAPDASAGLDVVRLRAAANTEREVATNAARNSRDLHEEWAAWLAHKGVAAEGDDPVAVRALLDRLREHREIAVEVGRLRREEGEALERCRDWTARLRSLVSSFAAAPSDERLDEFPSFAARIASQIEAMAEARHQREAIDAELATMRAEALRSDQEAARAAADLGVIAAKHGLGEDGLGVTLEAMAASVAEEHARSSDEYEEVLGDYKELMGRLRDAERADAVARAAQQEEGLKARAAELADEYVVQALAGRLLDEAQEVFEKERQPEVIRRAETLFSDMTGGRYERLIAPAGGGAIQIVDTKDGTRGTDVLSRGTAEQLYLALRIGVITTLGNVGENLPVLMDDIVVNFDPERREGAARAIARLAEVRQVIFFTCHDETAEVLKAAAPDCALVRLDRCGLS